VNERKTIDRPTANATVLYFRSVRKLHFLDSTIILAGPFVGACLRVYENASCWSR